MSGGNYFVSIDQVLCSAKLRRMKFFVYLETSEKYQHQQASCCTSDLTDEELETVDKCAEKLGELSSEENATLYYMSGTFLLFYR